MNFFAFTDQVSCVKSKHRSKPLCMWGIYSSPSLLLILNSALFFFLSRASLTDEVVISMTKYLTLINLIRVCTSGTIASAGTRRTLEHKTMTTSQPLSLRTVLVDRSFLMNSRCEADRIVDQGWISAIQNWSENPLVIAVQTLKRSCLICCLK